MSEGEPKALTPKQRMISVARGLRESVHDPKAMRRWMAKRKQLLDEILYGGLSLGSPIQDLAAIATEFERPEAVREISRIATKLQYCIGEPLMAIRRYDKPNDPSDTLETIVMGTIRSAEISVNMHDETCTLPVGPYFFISPYTKTDQVDGWSIPFTFPSTDDILEIEYLKQPLHPEQRVGPEWLKLEIFVGFKEIRKGLKYEGAAVRGKVLRLCGALAHPEWAKKF